MTPIDWTAFAGMTGTAAGGLAGLLFVAVSLNAGRIAEHRGLRASAAQTLVQFVIPLNVAAILLTPGQSDTVIGAELLAAGFVASAVLRRIGRSKLGLADDDLKLIAAFDSHAANSVVSLLLAACGICLICGTHTGLYLLLPASLVSFGTGVLNAWRFLLPPSAGAESKRSER